MSKRHEYRLDSLVNSVLRSRPMRPTPFGLHARIWRRLEIAAMIERERRRFRAAVERALLLTALLVTALAGLLWVWNPLDLAGNAVPGMGGLLDYARAYLTATAVTSVGGGSAWVWAFLAVLAVISIPLLHRLASPLLGARRP